MHTVQLASTASVKSVSADVIDSQLDAKGSNAWKPVQAEESVYFMATSELGREVHKVTCNYSTGEPDAYVEVSDLVQGKASGVPSSLGASIVVSPNKQLIAVTA